jgi:hypothetical protein
MEIKKKIKSIKIDFNLENLLPELNQEDAEKLGIENRPILLKREVLERNRENHPDITEEMTKELIGGALYNNDEIISDMTPGKEKYHHFIKYNTKYHSIVLLEISITKEYLEVVHFYNIKDKNVRKLEEEAERHGGRIIKK